MAPFDSTRETVLNATNRGLEVFRFYCSRDFREGKPFRSPFYQDDRRASCFIYKKDDRYWFKDHGDPKYHGDCFWFVGEKLGIDAAKNFPQIIERIVKDLHLPVILERASSPVAPAQPRTASAPSRRETAKKPVITELAWNEELLGYWKKYGITQSTLDRFSVVPLADFQLSSEKGSFTIKSSSVNPIFAYKGERWVKTYQPYNRDHRFAWLGQKPNPYCFGFEQLSPRGEKVFITGGEKDVLTLASHGYEAICFNSETASIPENVIQMLKVRFRHVILMYDCDDTGLTAMVRAVEQFSEHGLISVTLPLKGTKESKDISDFFAQRRTADELNALVAEAIRQSYGESSILMRTCLMDFDHPPESSPVVICAEGVPLGVHDNLLCVSGGEGTGKSNFVSALIAGAMLTYPKEIDTLGFKIAPNYRRRAVLHFDTEQSEDQLHSNMRRAVDRAGLDAKPDFYKAFFLASLPRNQRFQLIRDAIDSFHNEYKGVHLVVIDGVADLIRSVNNEAESIDIVEELYRMAAIYHTCIVCVLHITPNGIKLRGHLGSELQRKAAAILNIEKDERNGCLYVQAKKVREGNPSEVPCYQFLWDVEKDLFVSCGTKPNRVVSPPPSEEDYQSFLDEVFKTRSLISNKEIIPLIRERFKVGDRKAADLLGEMKELGLVVQDEKKQYYPTPNKLPL